MTGLKEKWNSLGWIKYLIITVIVVIIVGIVIFAIRFIKHRSESFNYHEAFDASSIPEENWSNDKVSITSFVEKWKETVKNAYSAAEGFVGSRTNFGNAERKFRIAANQNVTRPQQHLGIPRGAEVQSKETFVNSRQNLGAAERRYRQAQEYSKASKQGFSLAAKPQGFKAKSQNFSQSFDKSFNPREDFQQSRTKKDFTNQTILGALSAKTGINYKY